MAVACLSTPFGAGSLYFLSEGSKQEDLESLSSAENAQPGKASSDWLWLS